VRATFACQTSSPKSCLVVRTGELTAGKQQMKLVAQAIATKMTPRLRWPLFVRGDKIPVTLSTPITCAQKRGCF